MAKRKTEWYENEDYMKVRFLDWMHSLNESQKNLGELTNGEYTKQLKDIENEIEKMEANTFDDMMGNPMQSIDDMMEIFK